MSPPTLRSAQALARNNNQPVVSNDRRNNYEDEDENEGGTENPPPAASASQWQRFHLLVGGAFNFRTVTNYVDAPAYENVAPSHQGGGFFIQPGYSFSAGQNYDLRVGLNYDHRFFSTPASSPTRSSFENITLGGFFEASYLPLNAFGFGAQLRVGYTGIQADQVDVGLPASANFSFSEDGGLSLGGSLFLNFWNQAFRLGGSIDAAPTGFQIGVPPPDSPLPVVQTPAWSINAGVDIFRIVQNIQGNQ